VRKFFALAALLFAGLAHAGSAVLTCTPPTQNTDGSALTNLAGYRFIYGTSPTTLSQTVQVATPATCGVTIPNLTAGTWYFAAKAYTTTGLESAASATVSKTIVDAPPNPPSGLTVSQVVAFAVVKQVDRFVFVRVGTVPANTVCDVTQPVGAYYVVPRAAVTWDANVKPDVVVAQCS